MNILICHRSVVRLARCFIFFTADLQTVNYYATVYSSAGISLNFKYLEMYTKIIADI